jgi:hypothetical protein
MTMPRLSIIDLLRIAAWPFIIAAAAVSLCYAAAGHTLGFYLGPVLAITLILPVIVSSQSRLVGAVVGAGAIVDAVGIAWLLAVFGPNLTFVQWLGCYCIVAAYAFALMALTRATAAWFAVLAAVAWLTWPVWTSPFIDINLARWLTPAHPLLAINSLVIHRGVWLVQPLMYQYSSLGQDVPYAMPRSIWPCVIVHAAIALLLLAPGWWRARGRSQMREAAAESKASPSAAS